jgi:hypothetical protein
MIQDRRPDEVNNMLTPRGFNSRGELLWYPAGEILGFAYQGRVRDYRGPFPVICETPPPNGGRYGSHFIILLEGDKILDPWDMSPRPRPRTYSIRNYRVINFKQASMDLTQAIQIVSEAYQEVFGYPPARVASIHDAKLIQSGERTKETLIQSYRTEVEMARQKGLATSDRSAQAFNVMAYASNYGDIRTAFGINQPNEAMGKRRELYGHYMTHGIKEQRTDTPLKVSK